MLSATTMEDLDEELRRLFWVTSNWQVPAGDFILGLHYELGALKSCTWEGCGRLKARRTGARYCEEHAAGARKIYNARYRAKRMKKILDQK